MKTTEKHYTLTRRSLLKGMGSVSLLGLFGSRMRYANAGSKVNMGFIYVGPRDDFGYNQAHFEGKSGVASQAWVNAFDQESVPETVEVQKAMESMINLDGAQVLFPTSFGYFDPHILKIAKKYPEIMFRTAAASGTKRSTLKTSVVISAISTNRCMSPASSPD